MRRRASEAMPLLPCPMADPHAFIVVRSFSQPYEAHLACSALEAAGIQARIADEHIVAADWLYSNAVGGVKVLVRSSDVEAARAVLETPASVVDDADASPNGDS
jgi:hypothetical protein